MAVSIRTLDGKAVLSLAGELDLSNIESAESGLTEALTLSDEVIIDLSDLTFIGSTGIAFLVSAEKKVGPRLAVRESNFGDVKRVLEAVGLQSFFRQPELTHA